MANRGCFVRLLIIEDDEEEIELFEEVLGEGIDVVFARSLADAHLAIDDGQFDFVVCDLKIPSSTGLLDSNVQHGVAVIGRLRSELRGVPVLAFSAHGATQDILKQLLQLGEMSDFLGRRVEESLLSFKDKSEFAECVDEIARVATEIQVLKGIEVAMGVEEFDLAPDQKQALRLCGRRRNARVIRVERLGGGLSGSAVVKVQLDGPSGEILGRFVAKLSDLGSIKDERHRYQTLVSGSLDFGSAPGIAEVVLTGARRTGALVYELAHNYPETVFSVLSVGDDPNLAGAIRSLTAPWLDRAPVAESTVGEIRRLSVSDQALREALLSADGVDGTDLFAIDDLPVQARLCTQHGDLHGLNILVSDSGGLVLIDWGEAMRAPASLDPVTLELCLLFHPASPFRDGDWPTTEQAERWHAIDEYLQGCPVPEYVRACREWALDAAVAAGNREVAAVVLAYAARQLKYPETNHDLASALVRGAMAFLQNP